MSILTTLIAWLLSLVGLQDCTNPNAQQLVCPVATHTQAPASTTNSSNTSGQQQSVGFISNGL